MQKKIFLWVGAILAITLTIGMTYILVPRPYQVHYHANMAVFIDGKEWDFSQEKYMEEVSRCNVTEGVLPADRIHLHEKKGDLVHVHMAASTWGDLFSNLGWTFAMGYLAPDDGRILLPSAEKNLYFFLNGSQELNPWNTPVKSTDRLLVWYGTGTADEIQKQADTLVAKNADEYNHKADPASCSANNYGFLAPLADPIHEWLETFHSH